MNNSVSFHTFKAIVTLIIANALAIGATIILSSICLSILSEILYQLSYGNLMGLVVFVCIFIVTLFYSVIAMIKVFKIFTIMDFIHYCRIKKAFSTTSISSLDELVIATNMKCGNRSYVTDLLETLLASDFITGFEITPDGTFELTNCKSNESLLEDSLLSEREKRLLRDSIIMSSSTSFDSSDSSSD